MRLSPAACALMLLAGCAARQPAEPPDEPSLDEWPAWEVGDAWTWTVRSTGSDGEVREANVSGEVVEVAADTYRVRSRASDGSTAEQTFWRGNVTMQGSQTEALRFPLRAGANWTSGGAEVRVLGREEVATRAGTFEAWRLNLTSIAGGNWRDDWWAPEAKIWVSSHSTRVFQGELLVIDRELQEFRPASSEP